uniref:Ring finger protein 26 n=1 Tax=Mus musculus TaxID=10090 RepID=A0A1L1SUH0_MOUSE
MEAVYLVVNGVGLVLDLLTLMLDLNFLLVSSLLATLAWLLAFIYNLPHTVLTSLLHLGRGFLLSLLALVEAVVRFTFGGLQALGTLLYSCYSGLESLKLLGHLASHGALRSREFLNRGILNMVSNGHALLRQACDICAIAMSLVPQPTTGQLAKSGRSTRSPPRWPQEGVLSQDPATGHSS